MPLDHIEILALINLFAGEEIGDVAIARDIQSFKVVSREKTCAGFYSIIRFSKDLYWVSKLKERSWKFDHPLLYRKGGYFVCWVIDTQTVCLEAFSCSGKWPSELLPELLYVATCA